MVAGFWPKAEKGEKLFSFKILCFQNPLQCFELFLVFKLVLEQTCFGTFKIWDGLISTYYKVRKLLF
jgi:hypothetical protein